MTVEPFDLAILEEAETRRRRSAQTRRRASLLVPLVLTLSWFAYVSLSGQWDRVLDRWAAATTMIFGSFVAGATPQGGGAVAFPVFTKLLEVPSEVARTFSLCVQAVGMTSATLSILINRRAVLWSILVPVIAAATVGFLLAAALATDDSLPFRPSLIPADYIKVGFTVVIAALAVMVFLASRRPAEYLTTKIPSSSNRVHLAGLLAGLLGGALAAMVGSGVDVMVYLLAVVLIGFSPKVGIPTSVVAMSAISVLGFAYYGLFDGQLSVSVDQATVFSVGGRAVDLPADRYDLFGFWLASIPVVVWGAPLGSAVADRLGQRSVVRLVLVLATTEVLTTVFFLESLRRSPRLVAFAIGSALLVVSAVVVLARHRHRILGIAPFSPTIPLTRNMVSVIKDYGELITRRRGDR